MCSLLSYASQCLSRCSPQKMATRSLDRDCHPEAAESHAQASDSQRRISVLRGRKKQKPGAPFLAFCARSRTGCDKNDYRGILAGLEGVSAKKAVDSETMTVKN